MTINFNDPQVQNRLVSSNDPQFGLHDTRGLTEGTAAAVETLRVAIAGLPVSEGNAAALALSDAIAKLRQHGA